MGRNKTGALTTGEVCKLELKLLLKDKTLHNNCHYRGSLSWSDGSSVCFESKYLGEEKYIRLKYTLNEKHTGKNFELDYKIQLITIPSNLGKGEVLYFLCPQTGQPCRILYRAYGSHMYKSRKAYTQRLYYPLQVSSKLSTHNDKYWQLQKALDSLSKRRNTYTYKGKKTKRYLRTLHLRRKQVKVDAIRWTPAAMPLSLRRAIYN